MWKALLGLAEFLEAIVPIKLPERLLCRSSNYISEVPLIVLHQLLGAVVALIHMEKLSQLMEILALAKIFCLRIIARMRQMSRYALAV
ncbi:unnamed protein product [Sphagnum troendelagicum]|uniref:Uncharacterized protein n=1 Tax=Sphagnum troendelagicum TaxID=128251 RepID=A0ABP0UF01_9BRYO